MIAWLARRLKAVGGTVDGLTSAVWDAFKAVWNTLYALGTNMVHEWVANAQLAIRAVPLVISFFSSVWQSLKWTYTQLIPHWAMDTLHKAITWASREVKALGRATAVTVSSVRGEILRLIKALGHRVDTTVDAVLRRIVAAEAVITRLGKLVFTLLSDPQKMAAYVFAALWRLFWRTAERSAAAIARWLFHRMVPIVLAEIHLVERILADLF